MSFPFVTVTIIIIIRSGKREESNERLKYRLGRRLDKGRADLPIRDETLDPINSPPFVSTRFSSRSDVSFFFSIQRESILRYSPILLLNFLENFRRYIRGERYISNLLRQTRFPLLEYQQLAIVNRRDLIVAADGRRNRWTRSACTLNTSVLRDSSAPVQSCTQKV